MREVIATIKLAPGQVGYYDEYSRIHLTIAHPETAIYSGTNCAQIRRSIKAGRIILTSGTLGPEIAPVRIVKTPTGVKIVTNKDAEHAPVVANTIPVEASSIDLTQEIIEPAESEEVTSVEEAANNEKDIVEVKETFVEESDAVVIENEVKDEEETQVEEKVSTRKRSRKKKAGKAE